MISIKVVVVFLLQKMRRCFLLYNLFNSTTILVQFHFLKREQVIVKKNNNNKYVSLKILFNIHY
jgi:hypothetical protein